MNKLTRIFIVQRPGLEHRWWHRLAKVLIYGTTGLVFVLIFFIIIFSTSYSSKTYTYSFQPSYVSTRGEEYPCSFSSLNIGFVNYPVVNCKGIDTSSKLVNLLEQYQPNTNITDAIAGLRACDHGGECLSTDAEVVSALANNNSLVGIKVKELTTIDYLRLSRDFISCLLIVGLWFIFLESIIYRAIVYVIYGKRN